MTRHSSPRRAKPRLARTTKLAGVAALVAYALLCLSGVATAGAVQPVVTHYTTAGEHTFQVPAGVSEVTVTAVGAKGGGDYTSAVGGNGAYVSATIPVIGGSDLYAVVGGNGAYTRAGAGYGGAGGGGASDVRTTAPGETNSLSTRLLVAGGGGGAGAGVYNEADENETGKIPGGNAGEAAAGAGSSGGEYPGGGEGGGGGTNTGGGAGGAKDGQAGDSNGEDGSFGSGGGGGNAGVAGAGGEEGAGYNGGGAGGTLGGAEPADDAPGGGGGGGYYGGGGGGAAYNIDGGGGGGGGGSSYVEPAGTGATITPSTAAASITISYVPAVAEATTTAASSLTPSSAQLNGAVNPEGEETTYSFEYGLTTSYEATLSGGTISASGENQAVSASLTGLEPEKTYHYRLVAKTAGGTTYGEDETFTTPATPPAEIDLGLAQAASPNPVQVGEALEYTLTVSNLSSTDGATGVTVDDPLPGEATFVSVSPSQGTCTESNGVVSCALGGIAANASATVTVAVTPTHVGTLVNTAQVTGAQTDPETSNNSATTDTKVDAPPAVNTGNASAITETTATLNGSVTPEGEATSYYFEYGTNSGYGQQTATASAGSSTSAQLVEAALTGLEAGKTYHYRIVATNATNPTSPTYGGEETFMTPATPPADIDLGLVQAASANPVRIGEALEYTLTVSNLSSTDGATGVTVDDPLPGAATLVSDTPSQGTCTDSNGVVSCALGGIAANSSATVTISVSPTHVGTLVNTAQVTGDQTDPDSSNNSATTDTTVDAPPAVNTGNASAITETTATLNGSVTPEGEATSYYFEYGTTTGYGRQTASTGAGSSTSAQLVEAALTGLEAGKTYHYRLVATNATNTTHGADKTLATPATQPPATPTPEPTTPTPTSPSAPSHTSLPPARLALGLSNLKPSDNRPAGRIRGYGCLDHLAATFYVQPSASAKIQLSAQHGKLVVATDTLAAVKKRTLVVLCMSKQGLRSVHESQAHPKPVSASLTATATAPGQKSTTKTLKIRFTRR